MQKFDSMEELLEGVDFDWELLFDNWICGFVIYEFDITRMGGWCRWEEGDTCIDGEKYLCFEWGDYFLIKEDAFEKYVWGIFKRKEDYPNREDYDTDYDYRNAQWEDYPYYICHEAYATKEKAIEILEEFELTWEENQGKTYDLSLIHI